MEIHFLLRRVFKELSYIYLSTAIDILHEVRITRRRRTNYSVSERVNLSTKNSPNKSTVVSAQITRSDKMSAGYYVM